MYNQHFGLERLYIIEVNFWLRMTADTILAQATLLSSWFTLDSTPLAMYLYTKRILSESYDIKPIPSATIVLYGSNPLSLNYIYKTAFKYTKYKHTTFKFILFFCLTIHNKFCIFYGILNNDCCFSYKLNFIYINLKF